MNKITLEKFIKKYSLDGSVSAVRWKCKNEIYFICPKNGI